jgi:hypothetical protein
MQTVILPGYSPRNKEWADLVAKELKVDGIVRPILWDHWLDAAQTFLPKEKATLISRHARGESINIIAKSIGTLVASFIINQIPKQINKIIICGIPLIDLSLDEKVTLKKALLALQKDKVLLLQNEHDPHGSYNEVKDFLGEDVNLVMKEASNHEYSYLEDFNKFFVD